MNSIDTLHSPRTSDANPETQNCSMNHPHSSDTTPLIYTSQKHQIQQMHEYNSTNPITDISQTSQQHSCTSEHPQTPKRLHIDSRRDSVCLVGELYIPPLLKPTLLVIWLISRIYAGSLGLWVPCSNHVQQSALLAGDFTLRQVTNGIRLGLNASRESVRDVLANAVHKSWLRFWSTQTIYGCCRR